MSGAGRAALPAAIVLLALLLRVWQLGTLPLGLHGDEAVTGLDARRILAEGWVGPYLYPSALGQPAGPAYVAALVLALLGEDTFTLRLSMALFSVAAVACTYLAARVMFDRPVAVLAAFLLAVQPWHLHLGRIAFMVNAWPCVAMAALWLAWRARRSGRLADWAIFGAVAGLGIYTYNAYPLSLPVLAVPALCDLAWPPAARPRRRTLAGAAVAGGAALLVALPMLDYARQHEEYFWHQEEVGLLHAPAWRTADWRGRAGLLAERGREWGTGLLLGGRPDDGDGLGARGFPLLDPLTAIAALAGAAMLGRRRRDPAAATVLAALAVLPFGALLTIEDGLYRRTVGLAPFIAILAALPLAALWRRVAGGAPRRCVTAALAGGLLLLAGWNAWRYFGPLQNSEQMRYVFPAEVDAAARYVATLPADSAVYWYSDRWPADYETRRWFAPAARVSERSPAFGAPTDADGAPLLLADSDRESVFVLLGAHIPLADELVRRHPGAAVVQRRRGPTLLFRAVRVPPLA